MVAEDDYRDDSYGETVLEVPPSSDEEDLPERAEAEQAGVEATTVVAVAPVAVAAVEAAAIDAVVAGAEAAAVDAVVARVEATATNVNVVVRGMEGVSAAAAVNATVEATVVHAPIGPSSPTPLMNTHYDFVMSFSFSHDIGYSFVFIFFSLHL